MSPLLSDLALARAVEAEMDEHRPSPRPAPKLTLVPAKPARRPLRRAFQSRVGGFAL